MTNAFRTLIKRSAAGMWKLIPNRLQWPVLWVTQPKFNVGVTGLVFNQHGNVLLLNHVFRGKYPWGLPSGWLHPGETIEDALMREVREEVSIDISVDSMLEIVSGLKLRLEVVFLCSTKATQISSVSGEVFQADFFKPTLPPKGLLPTHSTYIARVTNQSL